MGSAVIALIIANSRFAVPFDHFLHIKFAGLSLLHWINDGLMAVFFLLIGLEIKREVLEGELKSWSDRLLPGAGALGGMVVPAIVYIMLNTSSPETLRGWAIPAATDIAFALGVLALFGKRVPVSLKIFLTALAIIDDLGAILIIGLFYTASLSLTMLGLAAIVFGLLLAMNLAGVKRLAFFLFPGALLWHFVLMSGVHATVAGVLLALTIPLRTNDNQASDAEPPLHVLEHGLQWWCSFFVLPIFGLANAGVSFAGLEGGLLHPVSLGVALGLFLGKQIGVFGSVWLLVKLGWAKRPALASWTQIYGVSIFCGIGFTMSLFIGALAFSESAALETATKIGVLGGTLLSILLGSLVLGLSKPLSDEKD